MNESISVEKDRGWLRILIPLYILGSGLNTILFSLVLLETLLTDEPGLFEPWTTVLILLQSFSMFVFSVASWRWKKWGCFGIIGLAIVGGLYTSIANFLFGVICSLVMAGAIAIQIWVMYALYKSKKQYFD